MMENIQAVSVVRIPYYKMKKQKVYKTVCLRLFLENYMT